MPLLFTYGIINRFCHNLAHTQSRPLLTFRSRVPVDFIPGPTVGAFVRRKFFAGFHALEFIKYS